MGPMGYLIIIISNITVAISVSTYILILISFEGDGPYQENSLISH